MKPGELFDTEKTPRLHVGMRIIKTTIAIYICAVIGYFLNEPPFFSMIAAVLCIQPTRSKSLVFGFNRILGTALGGFLGVFCVYISQLLGFFDKLLVYYLFATLMIIPLIELTLLIRKPSVSAFSCIVFLSVTVSHLSDSSPLVYAFERIIDTLIGIIVALVINCVFPISRKKKKAETEEPAAAEPPPEAESTEEEAEKEEEKTN